MRYTPAADVVLEPLTLEAVSCGAKYRMHGGSTPPKADVTPMARMMHVPGTVRGWILPPWEEGPVRLPSCQILIACHGEAASPIAGRAVYAPTPEVSFSCLLIFLHLASLAGM